MAPHSRTLTAPCVVRVGNLMRRTVERLILDRIDLQIRKGEFVALLGRSGSGKTTLLRALAGLDENIEGTGQIEVPEHVSVVFQDARLLPWRRIIENVVFGLKGSEARRRAADALAEVELNGRERSWPSDLSGGEQQRVALARALAREPELLLADEPFSALDALTRIKMHALLRKLCQAHQPAVLLVTHDVDEAIALAERVLVLENGRIIRDLAIDAPTSPMEREEYAAQVRRRLLSDLGVEEQADALDIRHRDEAAGGRPQVYRAIGRAV